MKSVLSTEDYTPAAKRKENFKKNITEVFSMNQHAFRPEQGTVKEFLNRVMDQETTETGHRRSRCRKISYPH